MKLIPIKRNAPQVLNKTIGKIMSSGGKFLTEAQLAEVLGLSMKQAVIKAAALKFSRIPVNKTRYYSKKQVQAYLSREGAR
jgi:hypothetical protein